MISRIPKSKPLADNAPHLLIIDDDSRIRELLQRYLHEKGFRVTLAADAAEARTRMSGLQFDLLVLDIMMPGESGLEFADSLRMNSDIPILMLSARSETENRIEGLEAGVDDYLAKPFDPRELLLRINNILRYQKSLNAPLIERVTFGSFMFDVEREELKNGDDIIRLTDRERDLLKMFAVRPGETIPRQDLIGGEANGERTVDVQINRLRRKIENDPTNPVYLQTIRGIGYRLIAD